MRLPDHRELLSGRRRGFVASLCRAVLWLGACPYGLVVRLRRWQYDRGQREIVPVGVPVISVGNLTTGGTGKTPAVADFARRLRHAGVRVAIVSRGYGAEAGDDNDEAKELYLRLPDVPHLQDPDRVASAETAIEELESEVILMDDGFQHRRLHRDLECVLIDATCPFGFGYLLPRGYLREPISSLRRADVVIVTRCDQVDQSRLALIEQTVSRWAPSIPIIHSVHRPVGLGRYGLETLDRKDLLGRKVALVSAIGNPEAFEASVAGCGALVTGHYQMPDHDRFDRAEREQIADWLRFQTQQHGAELCVCTDKDLVKLATDRLGDLPLVSLRIEMGYVSGEDELHRLFGDLLSGMAVTP